jgi:hypothetical protein
MQHLAYWEECTIRATKEYFIKNIGIHRTVRRPRLLRVKKVDSL